MKELSQKASQELSMDQREKSLHVCTGHVSELHIDVRKGHHENVSFSSFKLSIAERCETSTQTLILRPFLGCQG